MDPLSITTGVVALATLAATVTKTVNKISGCLKTADESLSELGTEIANLTSYLTTLHTSLSSARANSLDVVRIDDKLWEQTEVTLSACQSTLRELTLILEDVTKVASSRNGFNRRARITACLAGRTEDLAGLRDKVGKSNCALQTIMHIMQVHISIQNRASQKEVLTKLQELQLSIDASMMRARYQGMDRLGEATINHNLKALIHEARRFHSAASSASSASGSTEVDDASVAAPWQSYPGATSLVGDFNDQKRQRVHEFLENTGPRMFEEPSAASRRYHPTQQLYRMRERLPHSPAPSMPASDRDDESDASNVHAQGDGRTRHLRPRIPLPTLTSPDTYRQKAMQAPMSPPLDGARRTRNIAPEHETGQDEDPYSGNTVKQAQEYILDEESEEDEESDDEDEAELEMVFFQELRRQIEHSIRTAEYAQAIINIEDAMTNANMTSDPELLRSLRTQLALCHLMQGQREPAELLIHAHIARLKKDRDPVTCSLLHALAILQHSENHSEEAMQTCKKAYFGKKHLHEADGVTDESLYQTQGLLATLYAALGQPRCASALRWEWPSDFAYKPPKTAKEFLLSEESLRSIVLEAVPTVSVVPGYFEMSGIGASGAEDDQATAESSPLRLCSDYENYDKEVSKPSSEFTRKTPSQLSPVTLTIGLGRRFTQIFRGKRLRNAESPVSPSDSGYESGGSPVNDNSSPVSPSTGGSPWERFRARGVHRNTKETSPISAPCNFQVNTVQRVRRVVMEKHKRHAADDYFDLDTRFFDQHSAWPPKGSLADETAANSEDEDYAEPLAAVELDASDAQRPRIPVEPQNDDMASIHSNSERGGDDSKDEGAGTRSRDGVSDGNKDANTSFATQTDLTKPMLQQRPVVSLDTSFDRHKGPHLSASSPFLPNWNPSNQGTVTLPLSNIGRISHVAALLTQKSDTLADAKNTAMQLDYALKILQDHQWSTDPALESDVRDARERLTLKLIALSASHQGVAIYGAMGAAEKDADGCVESSGTELRLSRASALGVAELKAKPDDPGKTRLLSSQRPKQFAGTRPGDTGFTIPGELLKEAILSVKTPAKDSTINVAGARLCPVTPHEMSPRNGSTEEAVPAIGTHHLTAY